MKFILWWLHIQFQQKPTVAESRSSSLQEESFESETQLDPENAPVNQYKEKERCDIAIQTDEVSSYVPT